jgi:hypothetical protein
MVPFLYFNRHQFMKDVCLFIPEPGNMKASLAVSAIARAMHQMNKVAIVRCVWRQGQGNVAIGVLTPNISSVNNIVSIIFIPLTFESFDECSISSSLYAGSKIHFTSMCSHLLRTSESFSFGPSAACHHHLSPLKNNKKLQIT